MQRLAIYIIAIVIVFASCSRRPSYVIPESKMMDVLYDIQLAQAIYNNDRQFNTDQKKDILIAGVLKKHKISQAELDSSLFWYSDNIQYYNTITDSVSARLRTNSERMSAVLSAENSRLSMTDAILPPYYYLSESSPTLSLNIDSLKIKSVNLSYFNIKFDVQGVSSNQNVEGAVFFTYKDTLVKNIQLIDQDKQYIFNKPQLPDSLLESITGYIHLRNKVKGLPSSVVLYNISYSDSLSILQDTSNIIPTNLNSLNIKGSSPEPHQIKESEPRPDLDKPVEALSQERPLISDETTTNRTSTTHRSRRIGTSKSNQDIR